MSEPKNAECTQLHEYYQSLGELVFTRGVLLPRPPHMTIPKRVLTRCKLFSLFDIEEIVWAYNQGADNFFYSEFRRPISDSANDQILAIIHAAYVVSFAFGMGVARRSFDAYADFQQ